MRLIVLSASILACVVGGACGSDEAHSRGSPAGSAVEAKPGKEAPAAATETPSAAETPSAPAREAPAGKDAPAPPASTPAGALEQVQATAPGMKVSPAELKVTGIELFVISDAKPAADGTRIADRLVGVVGGAGGKVVEGNELVRAAIAAKPDPRTLAQVALRVAQYDGELLDAPSNAEQRKAKVRPPRFAGKALVFWVWTTGAPRRLEQGTLDRTTGALDVAVPPALRAQAITAAMIALGDGNTPIDSSAIRLLASACGEPRPKAELLSALANHPRIETRAAVADALHRCGPVAIQPLINAMERDRALVRSRAATALGRIGDGRARPALGKAAKSEDANLAWAAKNALGKIK